MTRFEPAEYERVTYPNYGGLIISQLELSDILELVSSPSSSMILEIGIGTGRILLPLSEKGSVLIGVDADPRMVKSVRERIDGASEFSSRDVQLLVAEGEHLPFGLDYSMWSCVSACCATSRDPGRQSPRCPRSSDREAGWC